MFTRGQGRFILVVEAKTGTSSRPPGICVGPLSGPPCAIPPGTPPGFDNLRPDVQMMVTPPGLGDDPDPAVCDNGAPPVGAGVPGFDVAEFFEPGDDITMALDDMSCKFEDRGVTSSGDACTRNEFGLPQFQSGETTRQYCFLVPEPAAFRIGETVVGIQLRDNRGNLGPRRDIVIRVLP